MVIKKETIFNEAGMGVVMALERIIKREGYIANLPWWEARLTTVHCRPAIGTGTIYSGC